MQSDFLGLILLAQGVISREDLYAALRRQSNSGEILGVALVRMGVIGIAELEQGVAAQISAPLFHPEWLPATLPEAPVSVPDGLEVVFLYGAEDTEIWGVRTPSGRRWLEERASETELLLGIYTLPDRYWESPTSSFSDLQEDSLAPTTQSLPLHTAIELMYEAERFQDLVTLLSRGLADICGRVTAGYLGDTVLEPELLYMTDGAAPLDALQHRESPEGWHIELASPELLEVFGPYGWCLHFGDASSHRALIGVFDTLVDDPVVFEDLTREFESAHKLLMERVLSG